MWQCVCAGMSHLEIWHYGASGVKGRAVTRLIGTQRCAASQVTKSPLGVLHVGQTTWANWASALEPQGVAFTAGAS